MRLCDLHNKQVINSCDCRILGCCTDIDFDECNGCLRALIVPGPGRICGLFGRDIEYIIPFKCIKGIGSDAIIVDVCVENVIHKCI